ncbi:MAG: hypothetical protein VX038_01260 [Verrucomicrobiota bacterium]|nr:hypothetical protein [Verrucomicrobiota bacterium]
MPIVFGLESRLSRHSQSSSECVNELPERTSEVEKGHLMTQSKKNSKQIWLSRTEVFNLPESLPVPPTIELITPATNKRPTA